MKCVVVELGAATYTFLTLRYVYKQQQQQLYSLYKNTKVHHKYAHFRVRGNNCETLVGAVTVLGDEF